VSTVARPARRQPTYRDSRIEPYGIQVVQRHLAGGGEIVTSTVPGGSRLPQRYAVYRRGVAVVFDSTTVQPLATYDLESPDRAPISAAVFLDNRWLVCFRSDRLSRTPSVAGPRNVYLRLIDTVADVVHPERELTGLGIVTAVADSPARDVVVAGTTGGKLLALPRDALLRPAADLDERLRIWDGHSRRTMDIAWLGDGLLASAGVEGDCAVWQFGGPESVADDSPAGDALPNVTDNATTGPAARTPQGTSPVDDDDATAAPNLRYRVQASRGVITHLGSTPDGRRFLTADALGAVRLWDSASGLELISFQPRGGRIRAVQFSPSGRYLMVADASARIRVLPVKSQNESGSSAAPPRQR